MNLPQYPTAPSFTSAQNDRIAGVLYGMACGDALGAPYEFQPARIHGEPVGMVGGGSFGWDAGEWTDDTAMAVCIADVTARGIDVRTVEGLDAVTVRFVDWFGSAKDVGMQTGNVLQYARRYIQTNGTFGCGNAAMDHASYLFAKTGQAGNGSLMRTAPVALAFLHDRDARDEAARDVSALTHRGVDAEDACALWCHAIAHAVLHGTFDGLRFAVADLPEDRRILWTARLDEAETTLPHLIPKNGWVVAALMAAWSAITHTPIPTDNVKQGVFAADHFRLAIDTAVRVGNDTDTVAAIAGGLLGARWGASAIPLEWQRIIHGYHDYRARDLIRLALLTANHGKPSDSSGYPSATMLNYATYGASNVLVTHPSDPKILLGGIGMMRNLPDGVTAVVSLCRLGAREVPTGNVAPKNHIEVWLIDSDSPDSNPHLHHTLTDTARIVQALREEGHTVLLHCVQAQSRTPTVAALYTHLRTGMPVDVALDEILDALPYADPNDRFRDALNDYA